MYRCVSGCFAAGLVLACLNVGRGQDPQVAAILDKAIQAAGGEARLSKFPALTLKGKGAYHETGQPDLQFTGTWYTYGTDKGRTVIEIDVKGAKSQEIRVVNKDKGWVKEGKLEARTMDKDDLIEERESLYFNWITTLAPLKGKEFRLALLDEAKVEGRSAVGFTVSAKGRRDVKLYFDKETGLLAKSERKVRDLSAQKEVAEEVIFSNYKDVDGVKLAMKYVVRWDGKPVATADMNEAKFQDKLDEGLFAKP